MDSKHATAAEIIRTAIAGFIQNEANANPLITITQVEVNPNFRHARVFFTTIPNEGEETALIFLKRNAGAVRHHIKKATKLKYIPHVEFIIDHGERHRQHIDTLVQDLENQSAKTSPNQEDVLE